jgi:Spy/CpxP family protein refolding chaperone
MKMKRIVLSFLVVAISAVAANAQEKHEGYKGMRKHHHHGMAIEKLNLSEDQKAQFKTLNADFHSQMQALQKQDNLTVKEWKNRKETLSREHKAKIQSLLTKEQKDQLAKMKQDRKAKMEEMSAKRMDMMKQRLALTDAQSAQIKDLNSELHEKIKGIRENQSLAKEEKREQIKSLVKENREKMKSILTEEQLQKMKDGRHNRQEKTK